nr:NADH dehydrogenase subunit 5 [Pingus sinensis]
MNLLIFLIFFSILLVGCFLFLTGFFSGGMYLFSWGFLGLKFSFSFSSLLFSLILLLVTLSVLGFSSFYMDGELDLGYYMAVLMIFVGSMFFLIFSNSIFTILVMWDLLGISSFFLVLFYSNWESCSSAMNTAMTNRLGDFFLFIFFCGFFMSGQNSLSLEFCSLGLVVFLVLCSFTKSAQFPFSSWLPKAMSAPTPVSSLVHSSTLVTAGLILLIVFGELVLVKNASIIVFVSGLLTLGFASFSALVECDVKKIVALSTLSQMGFCMVTLSLGLTFVSFLHLVSHALFKSCLFMQVGYIIHSSFGQQDGRGYGSIGSLSKFMQLQVLVTLFCLCGLLFTSGCVSKDYILLSFFSGGFKIFLSVIFFLFVYLTFVYSVRLWSSFFYTFNKVVGGYKDSYLMNFLSFFLVVFSIGFLWWLSSNMLLMPVVFLFVDVYISVYFVLLCGLLFFFMTKILVSEFIYKFLVDYFAMLVAKGGKNFKFSDMFLLKLNAVAGELLMVTGIGFNSYLKSGGFNSIVLGLFIFFLLI